MSGYNAMMSVVDPQLGILENPCADVATATALWKRALYLMSEFARDDYDLRQKEGFAIVQRRVELPPAQVSGLKFCLACIVAKGNQCRVAYSSSGTGNNLVIDAVVFYGAENDCTRAERIWASMEAYRASRWRITARLHHCKHDEAWRNGYYLGFEESIRERYERVDREWQRLDRMWRRMESSGSENDRKTGISARACAELVRLRRDAALDAFEKETGLKQREPPDLCWRVSRQALLKGRQGANWAALALEDPDDHETFRD